MPVAVTFDADSGIWVFELSGVVTPAEIRAAYDRMRRTPDFDPRAPRLWDARQTTSSQHYGSADLRHISRETGSDVPHRVAIVVARDVDFGLARMYEAFAEADQQLAETFVFRDLGEALAWLGAAPVKGPE